jgi:hypothetical protein
MDKSSFLVDIGTIVSRSKNVDLAYIFGSFLEGEEFNDIDIASLLSKNLNPYKSLKFSLKVEGELERQAKPRFEFNTCVFG